MTDVSEAEARDMIGGLAKTWWLFLVLGIFWVFFGMMILSWRPGTLYALAVFIGLLFIFGGVTEIINSSRAPSWRWLWITFGVLAIAAGIVMFFNPGESLYVIAVFLAWYLLISGIFNVVFSLAGPKVDWWWLTLLLGVLEFILGAWAIGSPGREVVLLINLAGIYALFHGFNLMFGSFALREARKDLAAA
jgi:uncharacterized membrane protein HdeD (DUF308 family)